MTLKSIENGEVKVVKVTNEHVLEPIAEKRRFLNNSLQRKSNWIDHIPRRNCLLHDVIEGWMTEMKGVGRKRTQLYDYFRYRRR